MHFNLLVLGLLLGACVGTPIPDDGKTIDADKVASLPLPIDSAQSKLDSADLKIEPSAVAEITVTESSDVKNRNLPAPTSDNFEFPVNDAKPSVVVVNSEKTNTDALFRTTERTVEFEDIPTEATAMTSTAQTVPENSKFISDKSSEISSESSFSPPFTVTNPIVSFDVKEDEKPFKGADFFSRVMLNPLNNLVPHLPTVETEYVPRFPALSKLPFPSPNPVPFTSLVETIPFHDNVLRNPFSRWAKQGNSGIPIVRVKHRSTSNRNSMYMLHRLLKEQAEVKNLVLDLAEQQHQIRNAVNHLLDIETGREEFNHKIFSDSSSEEDRFPQPLLNLFPLLPV